MLSPYRVLDLTDERGFYCGKVLADIGADVIKIEKPGGDVARNIGPFYHDTPHPEKSLYWFAYNTSKRGITLDIETVDGQEIFKRLVKTADIVVESFVPGQLDAIGLGYQHCSEINPGIILTSITPYGQDGPYKDFKGYDLQAQAMGGTMYGCGYPGEYPLSWGMQEAYIQGGLQAAAGTVMAVYHREMAGEGQHVDVSMRDAMLILMTTARPVLYWVENHMIYQWGASRLVSPGSGTVARQRFPCKDGYVMCGIHTGATGQRTNSLVDWMDEEGMAGDLKKDAVDFTTFALSDVSQEQVSSWEQIFAKFLLSKTKKELLEGAVERGIMLTPDYGMADVLASPQLTSRDYFVELTHPELGRSITYPGAFFKATETPSRLRHRAPLIGEHNKEVYVEELGFSEEQLITLKEDNII